MIQLANWKLWPTVYGNFFPCFSVSDLSHFRVSFIRGSTVLLPPPPLPKSEWGSYFVSLTIGSFGCEIGLLPVFPEPRAEKDAVAACEHAKFSRGSELESELNSKFAALTQE